MSISIEPDRVFLLDGGLATELERRGFDLDDPLWSARLLLENPEAIRRLHEDYYRAGCQCVITASYQATLAALAERGLSPEKAEDLLRLCVDLACQARQRVLDDMPAVGPLYVAASVGPYGAYLHDGSEYRGDYGQSAAQLTQFHRRRFEVLAYSSADCLACETLPCLLEAEVLLRLLEQFPEVCAWFSFSCKDHERISNGDRIIDAARMLGDHPQVAALGVNCTSPPFVESLATQIRSETAKPIAVYPNAGDVWDAQRRCWVGDSDPVAFAAWAKRWHQAGANLIGGCCRTGPEHVRQLANLFGRGMPR